VTALVAAFMVGVILMAVGFFADWNERHDVTR
jgi:hypothetical protein